MACDYRIGSNNPKYVAGLSETPAGLVAPKWLAQTLIDRVGRRVGEEALLFGTLFKPHEALEIGLVDQICPTEELISEAGTFKISKRKTLTIFLHFRKVH